MAMVLLQLHERLLEVKLKRKKKIIYSKYDDFTIPALTAGMLATFHCAEITRLHHSKSSKYEKSGIVSYAKNTFEWHMQILQTFLV